MQHKVKVKVPTEKRGLFGRAAGSKKRKAFAGREKAFSGRKSVSCAPN